MTADAFLAWEAEQTERHEFVDGEVFAMAGAEAQHVMVSGNVYIALRQHLRGTPCRAYMADMKIRARQESNFFYPDVVVSCTEPAAAGAQVMHEPRLLVEVLSPSTASYDRGSKFAHYRRFESLQELVFVDIDTRRCDVHRKGADGLWVLHPFEPGEAVHLASVALTISAEELFAELDEAPRSAADQQ